MNSTSRHHTPSRGFAVRGTAAGLALALLAGACSDGGVAPGARTTLALSVEAAQVAATTGRLQIEGPENRTLSLAPGQTQEIDLLPGSYTVALEGLVTGTVVGYWERRATVTEGRQTELTVSLSPFLTATPPSATQEAVSGEPFAVSWSPVGGAGSYDLQTSSSPTFSSIDDELRVDQTSTQVTVTGSRTVYFRVRPRTRFNGVGTFGPASSGTEVRIPVSSVVVSPQDRELEVGETLTYQATTRGPGGQTLTGRSVTWSSTNPAVATVNASTGRVSAVAAGTTTIEATSEGVTGTSVLTVVEIPATIVVEPSEAILPVGGTLALTATVRSGSGAELPGAGVIWSSDNSGIAAVDDQGVVTAVAVGSTSVRATVDGFPGVTDVAAITVGADTPPQITDYDIDFMPYVDSCRQQGGDFITVESIDYFDGNGDMDPSRTFEEPGGGATPQNIDTQFRAAGNTVWLEFNNRKRWLPEAGAIGSQGEIDSQDPVCFSGGDAELEYLDFRVRIQDAAGNWSPWFESRRYMPREVEVSPPGAEGGIVDVPVGAPVDFDATVIDFNGQPLSDDIVSWSNYSTPLLGTVSPDGVYTPGGGSAGADRLRARAAYADDLIALIAGGADVDFWMSPDFSISLGDADRVYRTRVYEGREYRFWLNRRTATSGEADLYLRFGDRPTPSAFDASSTNAGLDEEIIYTAPADGVVWILIDVVAPTDQLVAFGVGGDSRAPREYESLPPGLRSREGPSDGYPPAQDLGLRKQGSPAPTGRSEDPPTLVVPGGGGH